MPYVSFHILAGTFQPRGSAISLFLCVCKWQTNASLWPTAIRIIKHSAIGCPGFQFSVFHSQLQQKKKMVWFGMAWYGMVFGVCYVTLIKCIRSRNQRTFSGNGENIRTLHSLCVCSSYLFIISMIFDRAYCRSIEAFVYFINMFNQRVLCQKALLHECFKVYITFLPTHLLISFY